MASESRDCYTFEWVVYIYNGIPNSVIDVHVKSKNDDLGHHNVTTNILYHFGFCENYFENTLFAGDFSYGSKFVHFNVFDNEIERVVGRSLEYQNLVFWLLKEDGYYLSKDDKRYDDPGWIFRGHWQ
ncbi:hypothetical protein R6Q59_026157 [Mikania micrantha]